MQSDIPRNDKPCTPHDLRHPVDAIEQMLGEFVVDTWQGGEAADPKDGSAKELEKGG